MTSPTLPPVDDAVSDGLCQRLEPAVVQERRQERPHQDPGHGAAGYPSFDGQALSFNPACAQRGD